MTDGKKETTTQSPEESTDVPQPELSITEELERQRQAEAMAAPIVATEVSYNTLNALRSSPTIPARWKDKQTGMAKVNDMWATALYASEVGIAPLVAIQNMYLVNGGIAMEGSLISALIHRAGHLLKCTITADATTVECHRRDPFSNELMVVGEVQFTSDDARQAELLDKDEDSKSAWKKYPTMMQTWRAITFAGRLYYSDVLMGMSFTIEELGGAQSVPPPIPDEIQIDGIDPSVEDQAVADATEAVVEMMDAEVVDDE